MALRPGGEHDAYYELRYEQLVCSLAEEMERVLDFLDEPWEPQVADFPGQPDDFDRVLRATGKESSTLRRLAEPLTVARIRVWNQVVRPDMWAAVRRDLVRRGEGSLVDELTSAQTTV